MIKANEISNPQSCLNKARPDERLFVLLARDPAAPAAIRAWAEERIALGMNLRDDAQIQDALECATLMAQERLTSADRKSQ
jgi:hypothetical protein